MLDKKDIYRKIHDVYPDIGESEKDIRVDFDQDEHTWVVNLKDGNKRLKTFLDDGDAESCVNKNKCIGLGILVGQLKDNIKIKNHS